jgi:hypothetical protein
MKNFWLTMLVLGLAVTPALAQHGPEDTDEDAAPMSASTFKGLEWRSIGPAYNSGRVVDFAVVPDAPQIR